MSNGPWQKQYKDNLEELSDKIANYFIKPDIDKLRKVLMDAIDEYKRINWRQKRLEDLRGVLNYLPQGTPPYPSCWYRGFHELVKTFFREKTAWNENSANTIFMRKLIETLDCNYDKNKGLTLDEIKRLNELLLNEVGEYIKEITAAEQEVVIKKYVPPERGANTEFRQNAMQLSNLFTSYMGGAKLPTEPSKVKPGKLIIDQTLQIRLNRFFEIKIDGTAKKRQLQGQKSNVPTGDKFEKEENDKGTSMKLN